MTLISDDGTYLDGQALNLLLSLLTAANTSDEAPLPAFLPPPSYLALIATLAIHPTLTTRARSRKHVEESNLALRYLRQILKVVGPVNSSLDDAFVFSGVGTTSRRGGGSGARRRAMVEDASPTGSGPDEIENDLAQTGAIWAQVEDIWQVVGWAFNCSVLHQKRWARWRAWIEYMLDVFEEDWKVRELQDMESDDEEEDEQRAKSMIVRSLSAEDVMTGRERKIVRAIFADGGSRPAAEFPEIWKNETKERKQGAETKKMPTKIDIEADNYGDYMDEDEDSDLEASDPNPAEARSGSLTKPLTDLSTPLGGTAALNLRLRFLSLLSTVSANLPASFTTLGSLYDNYLEHIRPLPTPTFFMLISPSSLGLFFSAPAVSSLVQYILRSLITSSAPTPAGDDLTQQILEENYLPFPANTSNIADNAKVSLCVETLLRLSDRHIGLAWTPALQDAVELGIAAREGKATKARTHRKRGRDISGGGGGDEKIWLRASAERIRSVVLAAHIR